MRETHTSKKLVDLYEFENNTHQDNDLNKIERSTAQDESIDTVDDIYGLNMNLPSNVTEMPNDDLGPSPRTTN